jgi:hypothetical protein
MRFSGMSSGSGGPGELMALGGNRRSRGVNANALFAAARKP